MRSKVSMARGRIRLHILVVLSSASIISASLVAQSALSPSAVYLEEGFNDGGVPPGWTSTQIVGSGGAWSVVGVGTNPYVAPYEGSGMAKFNSYDVTNGGEVRFVTPAINLTSALDPFVDFAMYHDPEYAEAADSVYIEVSIVDSASGPWTTLCGVQRPRSSAGWKREAVSLLPAKGAQRVFVGFRGVSKYGNNIYIDAFRVADTAFRDIGVTAIFHGSGAYFPTVAPPGLNPSRGSGYAQVTDTREPATCVPATVLGNGVNDLTVRVENFGTYAEQAYLVHWRVDSQQFPPVGNFRTLDRNGFDTLTLSWNDPSPGRHLITAWTADPGDFNHDNDTARLAIRVLDSDVMLFEGFEGVAFPPAGWAVINRDGGALSPWFRGSSTSAFLPYEGNGFAADNFQRANGLYLDDYLISPPLSNAGQAGYVDSLLFYTRSAYDAPPAVSYPDSLTVLLSISGQDTADFGILLDSFEVSKEGWERRGYGLNGRVAENSTVYVAFRYLHYAAGDSGRSSNFVGIDDVEFSRSLLTSAEEGPVPAGFVLTQNFPNPFNPATVIGYQVPVISDLKLVVFDVLGREVKVLVNERKEPGSYTVRFNAGGLASGVYFCRLHTGDFVQTRKMLLMR